MNPIIKKLFEILSAEQLDSKKEDSALALIDAAKKLQSTRQAEIKFYQEVNQALPEDCKIALHEANLLDEKNEEDTTLLMIAIFQGHTKIAMKLMDEKVELGVKNKHNCNALMVAAGKNNLDILTRLIHEKVALDVQEKKGNHTALIYALMCGYMAIAMKLVDAGAALDIKDEHDDTALMIAAAQGYVEIAAKLIDAGAALDIKNEYGCTALILAANRGHVEIVAKLINKIDKKLELLNTKNNDGNTALLCALDNDQIETAMQLINAKADVNVTNKLGHTALILAAARGFLDIVTKLIDAGAALDIRETEGSTALVWAAMKGHTAVAMRLVAEKVDLNAQNKQNDTALTLAIWGDHTAIAIKLIEAGAKHLVTTNDSTALELAIERRNFEIIILLLRRGAIIRKPNQLFDFLMSCDPRLPEVLACLDALHERNQLQESKQIDEKKADAIASTVRFSEDQREKITEYRHQLFNATQRLGVDHKLINAAANDIFPTPIAKMIQRLDVPLYRLNNSDTLFSDKKEVDEFRKELEKISPTVSDKKTEVWNGPT